MCLGRVFGDLLRCQPGKEVKQQQVAQKHMVIREARDLLNGFGDRLLELGDPVWLIQRDALQNAPWLKNRETGPSKRSASNVSAASPGSSSM